MRTLCKAAVIATLLAAPVSQAARAEDSGSYAARLREESDRRMEDYFQQRLQEDREYELNRRSEELERRIDQIESQQRERHIWE